MNFIADLIPVTLFEYWETFNHDTRVNLTNHYLLEKLKEDRDYEVFVKLCYVKNSFYNKPKLEYREFENIFVSNKARFFKKGTNSFYKGTVTTGGYHVFTSNTHVMTKHRAVCYNFCPRPLRHKEVHYNTLEANHMDGDKNNNEFTNLEWMTHAENVAHAEENSLVVRNYSSDHSMVIPMLATVTEIPKYNGHQFVIIGQKEGAVLGISHKVLFKARDQPDKVKSYKGCSWKAISLEEAALLRRDIPEDLAELIRNYKYQRTGKINASRQRHVYIATNIETGEVRELIGSIQLKEAGFPYQNVLACIAGRRKQCAGHTFKVKPLAR